MPYPETTVPTFGDWDGNEDLSYSIVFDKVRADKERFLPTVKDDTKDASQVQQQKRRTTPDLTAPNELLSKPVKTGSRGSAQTSPKLSTRHGGRVPNEQRNTQVDPLYESDRGSIHSSSKPPNAPTNAKEMGFHTSGSHSSAPHEAFHGSRQGVPGPARQMRQEYPATAKMMRSHGSSETSSIADMPEKVVVPKFGDWDTSDTNAGDGFTVIFDRARDDKKANTTRKVPASLISPLPPAQDAYKDSHNQRKKRGWLNALCCASNDD